MCELALKVKDLLDYNPNTGEFRWKSGGKGTRGIGSVAGNINHGKLYISVNYKSYPAHHLAWLLVNGKLPSGKLIHIDGDPLNNRYANLKEVIPPTQTPWLVYVHKDKQGNVRYVGSGKIERANLTCPKSNRGKRYEEFVLNTGRLVVEILYGFTTLNECRSKESEVYKRYLPTGMLLNAREPNKVNKLPEKDYLCELFDYDESSKSGLKSKATGLDAGFRTDKYYSVLVNGKMIRAHRVVALLQGYEVSEDMVVDHVDGNPLNNRIENLRVVTQAENQRNMSLRKKSGLPPGVKYNKNNNSYVASIKDPSVKTKSGYSRQITREFKIDTHGESDALAQAIATRAMLLQDLAQRTGIIYSEKHR